MATQTAKELLLQLQQPGCSIAPEQTVQTVVVQRAAAPASVCSTGTDAVTLDSNSLDSDECSEVEFNITNGDVVSVQLMLGIFGRTEQYINDVPAGRLTKNTSDYPLVTDDTGASTPEVQYFNTLIGYVPMLITGIDVEVNNPTTVPTQQNQKLVVVTRSFDATEQCSQKRYAPLCSECQDENVKSWNVRVLLDALHDITYTILAGAEVTVKIRYAAIGSAYNMVPCSNGSTMVMAG